MTIKFLAKKLGIVVIVLSLAIVLSAQVRPVNDRGAMGLEQLLHKLNTTASVMMTGAHPDDEDSGLLAYLSRRDHARAVYFSVTRGDGGQNIAGPELFESLGVIRTEELLQARRLDGAGQLFGRAFDYGFSKTLAEAKGKWDEKIVVCDMVRAIRNFKPNVVISQFSGTPADGHGQHQYAGYITPLAIKAASDNNQCVGAGTPWKVSKFYTRLGFNSTATPGLRLNTGEYDAVNGRTYFEIAMEGRSQHKSQAEGRLELNGEQFSGLNLVESSAKKVEKETSVFDGLETNLSAVQRVTGASGDKMQERLDELQQIFANLLKDYQARSPEKLLPLLTKALKLASEIEWSTRDREAKHLMQVKQRELREAIRMAAGVRIDALSYQETVVAGESFTVATRVFCPPAANLTVTDISLKTPANWQVTKAEEPKENLPGAFRKEVGTSSGFFSVSVPAGFKSTQPYWLEQPRDGDLFQWPDTDDRTLPFTPQPVTAEVKMTVEGQEVAFAAPVQYRYADETRGEIRRDINVVPALTLTLDQKLLIVSQSTKQHTRRVVLNVENHSTAAVSGTASLTFARPLGITVSSANPAVSFAKKGEKAAVIFDIIIPANFRAGRYQLSASVTAGSASAGSEMNFISYPHIQTHRYYTKAELSVNVLDLKTAPVKVGYIMGSGDQVPEAIRQMGLDVTMLDAAAVGSGDLSKYDVIIAGVRAYEVRDELVAHNQKLMKFIEDGGTFIVQYQRVGFTRQKLTPFPAEIGPRVTDEIAPVTILQPEHPMFNFPNEITADDFKGWVQERNLYSFGTFDAKFTPLLESHDEGEAENKGGLVVADIGKGKYVYCSYSFFRQLPSGVGGAYRLFANMLGFAKAK